MTDTATKNEAIVVERVIKASQETIFEMWTDSQKISTWLTQDADLDPRAGGKATLVMSGKNVGDGTPFASYGKFLAVEPYSHLELTWGFDEEAVGVPQGSSIVSVDLIPHDDGTLVRVTHTDLPAGRDDSPYSERKGWTQMLEHLAEALA